MAAQFRLKSVQWMLLGVLSLSPAALLAQQETAKPETVSIISGIVVAGAIGGGGG